MDRIIRFQLIDMATGVPLVKHFKLMHIMFTGEVSFCLLSGLSKCVTKTNSFELMCLTLLSPMFL